MVSSFFLKKLWTKLRPWASSNSFKLAFQHMSHLFTNSPSRMVFEHPQNNFHPKDFASGSSQNFQFYFHIVQGHIPHWIAHILGMACLLTMTKPSCGVRLIVVGKMLYWLISYTLCLQYRDAFAMYILPYTNLKLQLKVDLKL